MSARTVAERIRQRLCERPIDFMAQAITFTGSLGVATVDPAWRGDVSELVSTADEALYEAKRRGRNVVVSKALGADGEVQTVPATLDLVVN